MLRSVATRSFTSCEKLCWVLLLVADLAACRGGGKESAAPSEDSAQPADSAHVVPSVYEDCDDGIDGDGDGVDDLEDPDCAASRPEDGAIDHDGDGYVAEAREDDDCDDADPRVHPGATERCDGIDNDCDGTIDEVTEGYAPGCEQYYPDDDGDGYGADGAAGVCACGPVAGTVMIQGDCDDDLTGYAADHFPGAEPRCDGFPDDNCDELDDDEDEEILGACEDEIGFCLGAPGAGCETWYEDRDADGTGSADGARCFCAEGDEPDSLAGYASNDLDCDDYDATFWYLLLYDDDDGDGYGEGAGAAYCATEAYTSPSSGDCDDTNGEVNPGVQEDCADVEYVVDSGDPGVLYALAIDTDCDGETNEQDALSCIDYPLDLDGDRHGSPRAVKCLCEPDDVTLPLGCPADDCDDSNPDIYPGAEEIEDEFDNNCGADSADSADALDTSDCPPSSS